MMLIKKILVVKLKLKDNHPNGHTIRIRRVSPDEAHLKNIKFAIKLAN